MALFPALMPRYTLAEVFGPGVAYVSRRSPSSRGWYVSAPEHLENQTATLLAVGGGIPYVVNAACVTPGILALLADAGAPASAALHTYASEAEYLVLLSRLAAQGLRLATQRPHTEAEVPASSTVVTRALLERLNNKGHIADLVPPEWLAPRVVYPIGELPPAAELLASGEPVVLKVATAFPTGAGNGVWICRTPVEIESAQTTCASERALVVEQYLQIVRSVCVHAVIHTDGSCSIPGVAEEITRDGKFVGNWLDSEGDAVPEDVLRVVLRIAESAASLGYRGLAGIDVAFCGDGSRRILDLNFRVNASTGAVWLRASIERTRGSKVLRRATLTTAGGMESVLRVVRDAVSRGAMIPLSIYDSSLAGGHGMPRVSCLLPGASRGDIEEEVRRLAQAGLS